MDEVDWQAEISFQLGMENLKDAKGGLHLPLAPNAFKDLQSVANLTLTETTSRNKVLSAFTFYEADGMNGKAFERNVKNMKLRIATLSTGAVLGIREFFYYLMSRCDVLPSIGKAVGHNLAHRFTPLRSYPVLRELHDRRLLSDGVPRNDLRRTFAGVLSSLALQFLMLHELSHIQFGHASLSEQYFADADYNWAVRRHTIELSADCEAAIRLAKSCLTGYYSDLYTQDEWLHFSGSAGRLYPLLLSVNLLFRLFGVSENRVFSPESLRTLSHPPCASRAFNLSAIVGQTFAGNNPDLWKMFAPVGARALSDSMQIWQMITGRDNASFWGISGLRDFKSAYRQNHRYTGEMMTVWRELRPLLEPHSLWPLSGVEEWHFKQPL